MSFYKYNSKFQYFNIKRISLAIQENNNNNNENKQFKETNKFTTNQTVVNS